MKIAIGCDEAACSLKEESRGYLLAQTDVPVELEDFGVHSTDPVDYPDIAVRVAEAVASRRFERGILLCGTGIGMASPPTRSGASGRPCVTTPIPLSGRKRATTPRP